jgi:DNA-binding SARP family transcriptional activator
MNEAAARRFELQAGAGQTDWPVLICLLGPFQLLKAGRPVPLRSGGKIEALLSTLALQPGYGVRREELLAGLWPDQDVLLAGQSLNSLVYSVHRLLGEALDAPPVLLADGLYRLNVEAGIGIDIACFDALVSAGERAARAGDRRHAVESFARAVEFYRGDLRVGSDVRAAIERERLRARFLTVLAQLADWAFACRDYAACLDHALRLLQCDPCREDAHRLVMRCYVRRGERAQALRQYHLCCSILHDEFDAEPEQRTTALFDQIRLAPETV